MDLDTIADMVVTQLKFKLPQEEFDDLSPELRNQIQYNRGVCFVPLKLENNVEYTLEGPIRELVDRVEEVTPTLVIAEFGSFNPEENYGMAQVVCGGTGKPILPFHTTDRPNASSAVFGVPHLAIVCRAQRRSDGRWVLRIFDARFEFEKATTSFKLEIKQYWNGTTFTTAPRRYQTALAFAIAKASIPYGSGPAYYDVRRKPLEVVTPNED